MPLENENDDLRSALTAAFEQTENEPAAEPEPPPKEAPPPPEPEDHATPAEGDDRPRDEKGRFKAVEPGEGEPPKPVEKAPAAPVEAAKPPPPAPEPKPVFSTDGARAPQSWRPGAREKFRDLPPEIQEEALRVDREVRRTMQESAEARQGYQRFRDVFAPAEPFLRAQGLDHYSFTQDAVQTALALAAGPQPTKAQAIARLIQIYGVDIPTLDSVLSGQAPQGGAPAAPPYDPRVDQLFRQLEQAKQERQTALEAQARSQLAEVESLEFFEDLREDMADLLEMASRRSVALTPKEAYHRAALAHPEISVVLQQREAAQKAVTASAATQRARAAASSIRGSAEVPMPVDTQSRSLRDDLSAAWDAEAKSR